MHVYVQFVVTDITDAYPALVDTSLRMLIQFLAAWRNSLSMKAPKNKAQNLRLSEEENRFTIVSLPMVLYEIESLAFLMLSQSRHTPRRLALLILKEAKALRESVIMQSSSHILKGLVDKSLLDTIDPFCKAVVEAECLPLLPLNEKVCWSLFIDV